MTTDGQPLSGKRVMVTRAGAQAARVTALLDERGAVAVLVPAIVITAPRDPGPLARAMGDLRAGAYGWVAFTSANGAEKAWDAMAAAGGDARDFRRTRLAAIGPATAAALEAHGLEVDLVARQSHGEGFAEEMLRALGGRGAARVLLPRAAKARDAFPNALRAAGHTVDVVTAYETRAPSRAAAKGLARELTEGRIDAVLFTSSSTVDNVCDLLGETAPALLAPVRVASIGPVTSQTARDRGLRVDVTAAEQTLPALVEALARSYAA